MARSVARTALMTEAQPLIPHAQGINGCAYLERDVIARGKGIPIKKANGAMSRIVGTIFKLMGKATRKENSGCNMNRYVSEKKNMPKRAIIIPFLFGLRSESFIDQLLPKPANTRNAVSVTAIE
jgi:hypothetical protein